MKVSELIQQLQQVNPDHEVMVLDLATMEPITIIGAREHPPKGLSFNNEDQLAMISIDTSADEAVGWPSWFKRSQP